MAKAIIARRQGDDYQSRFMWLRLLEMRSSDFIEQVEFERDDLSFIDDVSIRYNPNIKDQITGQLVNYDYFQCKYHVTANGSFNTDNLLDPKFINSSKSILLRLYEAYKKLSDKEIRFRLYMVSNWFWHPDDLLAKHISEERIRDTFYKGTEISKEGVFRNRIKTELNISDEELMDFLNILRFNLGKGLNDLQSSIIPYLKIASLKPIDPSTSSNIYDDLIWKWFGQGFNKFSKEILYNLLIEEKLVLDKSDSFSEISVRSFLLHARKPNDSLSKFLDLTKYFDGRYLRENTEWNIISNEVSEFLNNSIHGLPQPIYLYFDCHLSICFLLGYLVNPKFGIQIIPVQKNPRTGYDIWKMPDKHEKLEWKHELSKEIGQELVLCISISNNIKSGFQYFNKNSNLKELPILYLEPKIGIGQNIINEENAWNLGYSLRNLLDNIIPVECSKFHLFFSVPAAFAYILGNTIGYKYKNFQIYEYDFEGDNYPAKYYPSIILPTRKES